VLTGFFFTSTAMLATAIGASAQVSPAPDVDARRLSPAEASVLRIDGLLDETAWREAPVASGFRQREPFEGEPATETTEVRILFDDATLYVGILARDRSPDEVVARILQRDRLMRSGFGGPPRFAGDDAVVIVLDPFHDHRNAVVFGTNPNGAEYDALITDEGREFNVDWRGVWEVAARRTAEGWSAEFAIPFRSLRFPEGSDEPWGFNVYRIIQRTNEEVLWSSWSRSNEGFTRVSRAGHIHGLTDLPRTGLNVEVKPYVLTGARGEVDSMGRLDTDGELDVGLDVKYEVTPGLVLDATINTDFAQVEVDDQQVNLTRFSLFFPEKRDFFLENAGIFEMGAPGQFGPPPFLMFFSRRIGISPDGPIPVMGGLRLTGRTGRQTVGVINVVTDAAFDEPRTNHAIARVKRDIGDSSYLGAMVTDRRNSEGWNSTVGLDWSFWPTSTVNVQGFAAGTATSGGGGEGAAYLLRFDHQTDFFGITASQLGIGPEATADLGFISRTDIQDSNLTLRVTPRPQVLGLRSLELQLINRLVTGFSGGLQDWDTSVFIQPRWNTGDGLGLILARGFNRIDQAFDIGSGVIVPVGDYDTYQLGWFANTSSSRPLSLSSQAFLQWYFDGRVNTITNTIALNPNANLALSVGYTFNRVDLPGGAFSADLARFQFGYAFSTKLVANALMQYDRRDDELSVSVRINFIHRPGSDLFIVFNEERGSASSLWDVNTRAAVVKLTYLARL
jgi:hypothetical protein